MKLVSEYEEILPFDGIVDNKSIFFITQNNNRLYEMNGITGLIDNIFEPASGYLQGAWSYRCLIRKDDILFLIPMNWKKIERFSLAEKSFLLPIEGYDAKGFRDALLIDSTIWMLDKEESCIYVLDTDSLSMNSISLGENKCISLAFDGQNGIYGLSENDDVRVDISTRNIETIKTGHVEKYGAIANGELYFEEERENTWGFYSLDLHRLESRTLVEFPKTEEVESYRYWRIKKVHDRIFFLPHEGNCFFSWDLKKEKMERKLPFSDERHYTASTIKTALFDLIEVEDNYLLFSCYANEMMLCDHELNLIRSFYPVYSSKAKKREIELDTRSRTVIREGFAGLAPSDFIGVLGVK